MGLEDVKGLCKLEGTAIVGQLLSFLGNSWHIRETNVCLREPFVSQRKRRPNVVPAAHRLMQCPVSQVKVNKKIKVISSDSLRLTALRLLTVPELEVDPVM